MCYSFSQYQLQNAIAQVGIHRAIASLGRYVSSEFSRNTNAIAGGVVPTRDRLSSPIPINPMEKTPEQIELAKIKTALQRAGFQVQVKDENKILIKCVRYVITCFFCEDFQEWRLQPYNQMAQQTVREALR